MHKGKPQKGGEIMTNKKLARILTEAIESGDVDAIWFVIGELEKEVK